MLPLNLWPVACDSVSQLCSLNWPFACITAGIKTYACDHGSTFLHGITYIRDEACIAAHQQLFVEANRIKLSSS